MKQAVYKKLRIFKHHTVSYTDSTFKFQFSAKNLTQFLILKEPVLPQIGQNWHDVKKDGMCT